MSATTTHIEATPRERLAAVIREKGFRKGYVAERAGIPSASLSSLLSGNRKFTPNYAVKLARALGVPVETFLPDAEEGA